ncbi:MAG TPA: hypothetical protein DC000_03785 [Clostridiales bacterium]|nr:hypothetical protein [Clostridiales bacterium]
MTIRYLLILYVSLMLHEIGHFITALIIHAKIIKFNITLFGINMQININDLSLNRKLALFFSGPFTNILIMLLSYRYRQSDIYTIYHLNDVAYINIFLSLINLLPIIPLDGGNVLKSILERYIKREYVYRIVLFINIIFLIISAYCFYLSFSVFYLAISFMALKGIFYEKTLILEEKIKNTYKKFI